MQRLAALLKIDPTEINTAIDSNPGFAFDLVRIAEDVDPDTARVDLRSPADDLPGVEVVVEARRQYTDGPLLSQILGYTGPVSASQLATLKATRLPARRPDRQGRRGIDVRDPSSGASTAPRPSSATPAAADPGAPDRPTGPCRATRSR